MITSHESQRIPPMETSTNNQFTMMNKRHQVPMMNKNNQMKVIQLSNLYTFILIQIFKKHHRLTNHFNSIHSPLGHELTRFILHLLKHLPLLSNGKVLIGLWYLNRFMDHLPFEQRLNVEHINTLLVACLSLSDIQTSDLIYSAKSWSKYTGLPIYQIIDMKRQVLTGLQYDLSVCQVEMMNWMHLLTLNGLTTVQTMGSQNKEYSGFVYCQTVYQSPPHSPAASVLVV